MADQRYIDFIETIIEYTKTKKLDWYYLDTNEELYTGMEWTKPPQNMACFLLEVRKK